jgi:hypothetical protein
MESRWIVLALIAASGLTLLNGGCAGKSREVSTDPRGEVLRGPEPITRFQGPFGREWEWVPGGWVPSER